MIKVYTAGYMHGEGSDRFNWRKELQKPIRDYFASHFISGDDYSRTCDNFKNYIHWLNPGVPEGQIPGKGDPQMFVPRDLAQIQACDVMVAQFDLSTARCMGAATEVGLAYAWQKRIIMIDKSPDIGSLDFIRGVADAVYQEYDEAAEALVFIAEGLR